MKNANKIIVFIVTTTAWLGRGFVCLARTEPRPAPLRRFRCRRDRPPRPRIVPPPHSPPRPRHGGPTAAEWSPQMPRSNRRCCSGRLERSWVFLLWVFVLWISFRQRPSRPSSYAAFSRSWIWRTETLWKSSESRPRSASVSTPSTSVAIRRNSRLRSRRARPRCAAAVTGGCASPVAASSSGARGTSRRQQRWQIYVNVLVGYTAILVTGLLLCIVRPIQHSFALDSWGNITKYIAKIVSTGWSFFNPSTMFPANLPLNPL